MNSPTSRFHIAGDAVPNAALAEPSAQVAVVVALVRMEFARASSTGPSPGADRRDAAHERFEALAVVHIGAGDAER
jgi:hypothetical protein